MLAILFFYFICCKLSRADSYPEKQAIDSFVNSLTGKFLKLGDSQYQNASKMINSFYTKRPGFVVMAKNVEDVIKSVLFAKDHNLILTVRSTGHDYNGRSTADGSLMIDLSSMKDIVIDLKSMRHSEGEITVDSGNTWLEIYKKVHDADRVVVGGSSHSVSPGGYTLGGGHSPISRSFGLAVDQVLEMRVVIADGRIIDCTANGSIIHHTNGTVENTNDTDLFWALRGGGGGTFGIVVRFTYKLYYQPKQLVKMTLTVPLNDLTKSVEIGYSFLEAFNEFIKYLPNQYGGYLIVDNFPSRTPGIRQFGTYRLLLIKFGTWDNETEKVLEPFSECISEYGCTLNIETKTSFYDYEKDMFDIPFYRVYTLGAFLQRSTLGTGLSTFVLPELVLLRRMNVSIICVGTLIGGKVTELAGESTPIHSGFRNGLVCLTCAIVMLDPSKDRQNIAAGKKFSRNLQQYGNGVYLNEAAYDLDNWQEAFWEHHYSRLEEIKRKWDPTNVFTCHHCVGSEIETIKKPIVNCD